MGWCFRLFIKIWETAWNAWNTELRTRTQGFRKGLCWKKCRDSKALMGIEHWTQMFMGNTSHELPLAGGVPLVLGRHAVLCSTASHPLRLSASRTPATVGTVGMTFWIWFVWSGEYYSTSHGSPSRSCASLLSPLYDGPSIFIPGIALCSFL